MTHEITVQWYRSALHSYFLDNSPEIDPGRKRPFIMICPGGRYEFTSDREAEPVALRLCAMGYHAGILRYSCAPARFPVALEQLARAVAYLRDRAEDWNINSEKIIVMGFSAGGHLACSLGAFWNSPFLAQRMGSIPEAIRPNGVILGYPVITTGEFRHSGSFHALLGEEQRDPERMAQVSLENQVGPHTPPMFLWHTYQDDAVPLENTMLLAAALRKSGVAFELHIYPHGPHGLSLGDWCTASAKNPQLTAYPEVRTWIDLAGRWIRESV